MQSSFYGCLTHWGQDKMAAISQMTLSNAFSWMKMLEFRLRFHWSLFLRVQLTTIQHWFRQWLGAGQATSHYLNQWWLDHWRIYASIGLNELSKIWWMKECYHHQCQWLQDQGLNSSSMRISTLKIHVHNHVHISKYCMNQGYVNYEKNSNISLQSYPHPLTAFWYWP